MIRKLYHGSAYIIKKPIYGGGKPYNDYGPGFYCTESIEMAREWSVGKNRDGYADFINGTISVRQLNRAMHLGNLGQQFVLKSRRAFEEIVYTGNEPVSSSEWYERKMKRDRAARREYFSAERSRRKKGDLYITRILDEEIKKDDPRL